MLLTYRLDCSKGVVIQIMKGNRSFFTLNDISWDKSIHRNICMRRIIFQNSHGQVEKSLPPPTHSTTQTRAHTLSNNPYQFKILQPEHLHQAVGLL